MAGTLIAVVASAGVLAVGSSKNSDVAIDTASPLRISARFRGPANVLRNSEPIYYVDGVRTDVGLDSVTPDNIARIEVIKDAAAASPYGWIAVRNGVIRITTKDGVGPPDRREFREHPILTFHVAGNKELTERFIESLLLEAGVEWKLEQVDPVTYLSTWPRLEPRSARGSRFYKATLQFSITAESPLSCSTVGLSWLWKVRGQSQRVWQTVPHDQNIGRPAFVDSIVLRLDSQKVREGCQ